MLDFFKDLLVNRPSGGGNSEALPFSQEQLAAAALMLEVAAADHTLDDAELATFKQVIGRAYHLDSEQVEHLHQLASHKQENATSLHQFTQRINEHSDHQEKFNLIKAMWQVALADDDLHKYEENIIRRVADLIYVSHTDFLVARNLAREEQQ
ncbi:MAG TPA: TerB family tellurite resistance protein [Cellvibrionaceae bacterium]